jgi:hypothetical protein
LQFSIAACLERCNTSGVRHPLRCRFGILKKDAEQHATCDGGYAAKRTNRETSAYCAVYLPALLMVRKVYKHLLSNSEQASF